MISLIATNTIFPLFAVTLPWLSSIPLSVMTLALGGIVGGMIWAAVVSQKTEMDQYAVVHSPAKTKARRVLIVGAGTVGQTLAQNLEQDGRYQVIGYVDDHPHRFNSEGGVILGGREATATIVQEYCIDDVFLAYAPNWQQRLAEELIVQCPEINVRVVPTVYEALLCTHQVKSLGDIALVPLLSGNACLGEFIKRSSDIVLASIGLVLCAPLLAVVAILLKITAPGPVFFAQKRVGRYGKVFTLYKVRTMRVNAEKGTGPVLSSGWQDTRLTKAGRLLRAFRIDELPQLFNVLRGEMSLVGPRPERPIFVEQFEREIPAYAMRHQVRPGITGLAQVCGGYHTDARDKLRFDLLYITHQSLWLDLGILFQTIFVVSRPYRYRFDR